MKLIALGQGATQVGARLDLPVKPKMKAGPGISGRGECPLTADDLRV